MWLTSSSSHTTCWLALAPGPAQAFENMHCHRASFLSLTAGPTTRSSSSNPVSTPLFSGTPPLVWLFWNESIPPLPEAAAERRECSWTGRPFTSRAPRLSPTSLPCALSAPWPSQAGESYVTGCYVIGADRGLLCSAQLRNVIPCCCKLQISVHVNGENTMHQRRHETPAQVWPHTSGLSRE